ncbi:MAG: hypothetical protein ACTS9Y_10595 [Methylophilus sp.]|uniref:hypothetical protein n=1 Tax=Methylophilus sp. TaxID=29541 RepID=UPI003FA0C28B
MKKITAMKLSKLARYRLMVASRILAAIIGGYALTSALSVLLALLLPVSRSEATLAATMLSFVLYAAVVLWVFAARSVMHIWLWLIGAALPSWLLCWWLMPGAAS